MARRVPARILIACQGSRTILALPVSVAWISLSRRWVVSVQEASTLTRKYWQFSRERILTQLPAGGSKTWT
jgi:hypothetical protein